MATASGRSKGNPRFFMAMLASSLPNSYIARLLEEAIMPEFPFRFEPVPPKGLRFSHQFFVDIAPTPAALVGPTKHAHFHPEIPETILGSKAARDFNVVRDAVGRVLSDVTISIRHGTQQADISIPAQSVEVDDAMGQSHVQIGFDAIKDHFDQILLSDPLRCYDYIDRRTQQPP